MGVVNAGGVSGAGVGPVDKIVWSVLINLSGWKPVGGQLRKSELTIRKVVPEAAVQSYMAAIASYDVIRIKARWSEDTILGSPQALLTELVGKDTTDAELNAYALELQQAVTFTDPQFGVFSLDRSLDWYQAIPQWRGNSIRLSLNTIVPEELNQALVAARLLWVDQDEWHQKVTAFAISKLLELKNGSWLGDGEAKVSKAEFARKMSLESIILEANGSFEFWHNDGDLFWGHSIRVSGNMEEGPIDAGIEG